MAFGPTGEKQWESTRKHSARLASFAFTMPVDLHCKRTIQSYVMSGRRLARVFQIFLRRVSRRLNRAQPPEVVALAADHGDSIRDYLIQMFGNTNPYLGELAYWNAAPENLSVDRLDHIIRRQPLTPFLQTFYLEVLVPKVYEIIECQWYVDTDSVLNLRMGAFDRLGQMLLDSVFSYGWDAEFLMEIETCGLCRNAMFLTRFRGRCGHMFHRECIEDHEPETCPECHDPGF